MVTESSIATYHELLDAGTLKNQGMSAAYWLDRVGPMTRLQFADLAKKLRLRFKPGEEFDSFQAEASARRAFTYLIRHGLAKIIDPCYKDQNNPRAHNAQLVALIENPNPVTPKRKSKKDLEIESLKAQTTMLQGALGIVAAQALRIPELELELEHCHLELDSLRTLIRDNLGRGA